MSMMKIASAHLWVHDQDVALKYWTEKVGMEVRQDVSMPELEFRWLTVGPPGHSFFDNSKTNFTPLTTGASFGRLLKLDLSRAPSFSGPLFGFNVFVRNGG